MNYLDKSFKIRSILYLSSIVILIIGASYLFLEGNYLLSIGILFPIIFILIFKLFKLVNKTNRDLIQFLDGLKYNDFEQIFAVNNLNDSNNLLYTAFNQITDKIQSIRTEQEVQNLLMQTIISNVDTGIFCIDKEGKCLMMNASLKSLLHKSYIPKFDNFKQITPNLYKELRDIKPGERKIVKETILNEIFQIAVQVYILKIKDEEIKVYTFYNIQNELSDQEVKSWQKLIRFLGHEIMNSIAPIASLSASGHQLFTDNDKLDAEEIQQIKESFEIIKRRSNGLLKFTESYRSLTRIPPPQLKMNNAKEFINALHKFFEQELSKRKIKWEVNYLYHELVFDADPILLEQVFINVIKNSIEALEDCNEPMIKINVDKINNGKISFQIIDNGKGITLDDLDKIFVPFFTTKENGSGIGLSLSQQIVRLHGGNIYLESTPNKGTSVMILI